MAKTVKQHHEHVDGSDYPDGLNGIKTSISSGLIPRSLLRDFVYMISLSDEHLS
ncbi:hypothetical protein JKG47_18170, partial [Acidithiobacillus sp. MC6.1]|nr:hypothetical protein [Acidithiobacillus sp. MC6.1]